MRESKCSAECDTTEHQVCFYYASNFVSIKFLFTDQFQPIVQTSTDSEMFDLGAVGNPPV